jgi:hypothetical protein
MKSAPAGGESPMVDMHPGPKTKEIALEPAKPPSPMGAQSHTGARGAPPSPTHADSSHDAAGSSPRSEPAEFPESSSPYPQSYGLGATG